MARYVAFLRAINVGGHRLVPMARLRDELARLGYSGVSTFLNSGNAIFDAKGGAAKIERAIEARLAEVFGFDVPTLLRSSAEVAELAARAPFGRTREGQTHMVALLRRPPAPKVKAAIEALSTDRDRIVVHGRDVHWLIDGKLSETGLRSKDWSAFGGEVGTTRNTTMLVKLAGKLAEG